MLLKILKMSSQKANKKTENFINEKRGNFVECLLFHLERQKYAPQKYQKIDGKIHYDR